MKVALALIVAVHGLIHLMGFAKAFGYAELEALKAPISKPMGVAWLVAALLALGAAAAIFALPRWWWLLLGLSAVTSQAVIISAWSDAKFGTIVNVIATLAAVLGFFQVGPWSLRAAFERQAERGLARAAPQPLVTEQELVRLPAPVARYLRVSGVVGKPHVQSFHVRMTGRIRAGPDDAWMPLEAEQYSFVDQPTRLFFMTAVRGGIPAVGLHVYEDGAASMRVKLLSMVPLVDAGGDEFTRTETVTLLNDMCLMAPATLLSPNLEWQTVSATEVVARFTHGRHTVSATLVFAHDSGELADFFSDDRPALAKDNVHFTPMRWSTPVKAWGTFGGLRLASSAEARYHAPTGPYAYAEFELKDLVYNVR